MVSSGEMFQVGGVPVATRSGCDRSGILFTGVYSVTIITRAGGRTGLAGQGRGRSRMSVRPCRPWWYHISGHYPCLYAEIETSKLNIRLQSTVSLSIQARSTDYSKMSSKSAVATNSFLVLNAPTKKVQDYKQMKPTGAVSWVWDHFSAPRMDLIIKI